MVIILITKSDDSNSYDNYNHNNSRNRNNGNSSHIYAVPSQEPGGSKTSGLKAVLPPWPLQEQN